MGDFEKDGKSVDVAKRAAEVSPVAPESRESAISDSKLAREANENDADQIWVRHHDLGQWSTSDEERVRDTAIKKGLSCRAIGGVDATTFDAKKIDEKYIEKSANLATKFLELHAAGKIASNFGTLSSDKTGSDVISIIDDIATAFYAIKQGRFNLKDFKDKLESKYPRDLIYGPQGAFNILLAINRADEAIKGKDVKDYVYDLRAGKKKLSRAKRFSALWQDRKPKPSAVSGKMPDDKAVEKAEGEFEQGVGRVAKATEKMAAEYGSKVKLERSKNEKGDEIFTMKCDLGFEKCFYLRVAKRGSKVEYFLNKVAIRDGGEVFDSDADAVVALKAKMDKVLKASAASEEKEKQEAGKAFAAEVKEFIKGDFLKETLPRLYVASENIDDTRVGEVFVKGHVCVLHLPVAAKSKEEKSRTLDCFVFVDEASREIEFKAILEGDDRKLHLSTIDTIKPGNLKSEEGKKAFALKIKKIFENIERAEKR